MEVLRGLAEMPPGPGPTYLALGMFDGVHLGHQAILAQTRLAAREAGGRSVVLTFDPHPQRIIAPPPEPILLTTVEERLDLFAAAGLDAAVVERFDERLRHTPAAQWLDRLAAAASPGGVVVSSGYSFGEDREGGVELLRRGGRQHGFAVTEVPAVHVEGTLVSSTLVRRLVRLGDVGEAARFLGRAYTVRGRVVEGERRGRTLGFPTANLAVHPDKVLPQRGIYAAWARLEEGAHPAAVSIGTRPTFGPGDLLVEAFLLDFDGDLYGREVELALARRLRDERAFRTVPELIGQMNADVGQVRTILAEFPGS